MRIVRPRFSVHVGRQVPRSGFRHGVIRHRGTVQHLFRIGRIFVVVRNRASAAAVRAR